MRAELDAAFFHLYRIDRDDDDYIMETLPIVKRSYPHRQPLSDDSRPAPRQGLRHPVQKVS